MFLVTSSLVGIAFLDEALTLRKGAGIVLAVVAVLLVTTE
jgi:transporter family protein